MGRVWVNVFFCPTSVLVHHNDRLTKTIVCSAMRSAFVSGCVFCLWVYYDHLVLLTPELLFLIVSTIPLSEIQTFFTDLQGKY